MEPHGQKRSDLSAFCKALFIVYIKRLIITCLRHMLHRHSDQDTEDA